MWPLKTSDIERLQIELSNRCNAACPLCPRYELPENLINNTSVDIQHIIRCLEKDPWDNLKKIHFCGNYDEPTVHPHLLDICEWIIVNMPNINISISTNGGTRDTQFWQSLGKLSRNNRLRVYWGIDGLEDTNHLYRKNVDWNKLWNNVMSYNAAGGYSTWQFIGFSWNNHQLETIIDNHKKWGFNDIKVVNSWRDISEDDNTNFDLTTIFKDEEIKEKLKPEIKSSTTKCKAQYSDSDLGKSLFLNFQSLITPCCYSGDYMTLPKFTEKLNNYSMYNHSIVYNNISDILSHDMFYDLNNMIRNQKNEVCNEYCRTFSTPTSVSINIE